jgi:hypothetical protein
LLSSKFLSCKPHQSSGGFANIETDAPWERGRRGMAVTHMLWGEDWVGDFGSFIQSYILYLISSLPLLKFLAL